MMLKSIEVVPKSKRKNNRMLSFPPNRFYAVYPPRMCRVRRGGAYAMTAASRPAQMQTGSAVRPQRGGRGAVEAVAEAFLVHVLARPISAAVPTTHPSSIKIPCVSRLGAIEDYLYVVVGYTAFGGKNCFSKLPPNVQAAHVVHGKQVMALIDNKYGAGLSSGASRYLTRPSGVWLPCENTKSAVDDYRRVVLNYEKYSGRGCWYLLPDDIKALHNQFTAWAQSALR